MLVRSRIKGITIPGAYCCWKTDDLPWGGLQFLGWQDPCQETPHPLILVFCSWILWLQQAADILCIISAVSCRRILFSKWKHNIRAGVLCRGLAGPIITRGELGAGEAASNWGEWLLSHFDVKSESFDLKKSVNDPESCVDNSFFWESV